MALRAAAQKEKAGGGPSRLDCFALPPQNLLHRDEEVIHGLAAVHQGDFNVAGNL